jgi:hypothetical protein
MAEFAWNNHHHSSINMTPFFVNYGMHPTMTDVPSEGQCDTPTRIKRLKIVQQDLKGYLERAQEKQATSYNKKQNEAPKFEVGEKVYVSTENMVTDKGSKKLSDLHTGPFTILKQVGDSAFKLKLLPHMKCHPVFNVILLSKVHTNEIPGREPPEPAPVVVNRHDEYIVEKILASNWLGKHFQYKV